MTELSTYLVLYWIRKYVFFGKRKNNTHKTFHTLKMKAHFEKEPDFENKSLLQTESNKKRAES